MKKQNLPTHPRHSNNADVAIDKHAEEIKDVERRMREYRNMANKALPKFNYKLYLQHVGKYAYLRWRGNGAVISTRDMKKLLPELPKMLKHHAEKFNDEAENLNLKYSMLLKIQQAKNGSD